MAGNRCYYAFQKLSLISGGTKIRIYRTVIRPTMMYGAETWVLTNADENALNIWERKIITKIVGSVQGAWIWKIINEELYDSLCISYQMWSQKLREHDSDCWAMLRECQSVD
jgi:hypothetical protein